MIYTLTLNPAIDYVLYSPECIPGEINRSENEKIYPGGKGINVSAILKELGMQSVALGFCAGYTGTMLYEMLKSENIDSDFVMLPEGMTRINVKIKSKLETDINANAPHVNSVSLEKLFKKLDLMVDGDTLVLAGSVPKSLSPTIYCDIMALFKRKNIRFVVDATKDTLIASLKYKPFLIKPNNFELCEIFGKNLENTHEIVAAAKELQKKGAQNVLVSLGSNGAILVCDDGNVYMSDAPKGKVINTTGAGDSMVAGFLAGYSKTEDYSYALKLGLCCGSATAFSESLASKDSIESLFNQAMIDVRNVE
ncbi:MAG: 1-phosphofructokinase [Clostridia bacterium]|nr:1-phosphofructokinase [Clostridia bacterium]